MIDESVLNGMLTVEAYSELAWSFLLVYGEVDGACKVLIIIFLTERGRRCLLLYSC